MTTGPALPADTDNPWVRRLPILIGSHVVGTVNVVSVMAMAPSITGELGLSAALFGTFVSAYYGAQAMGSLPAGSITDRFGIGRALVIAHAMMIVGALVIALAPSYATCIGGMMCMGLGYSMTNPSTARGVLDWFPAERRGLAMGLKQVGVPIGGVLAAGNGALAAYVHWQSLMYGVAVLIALNGILCFSLFRFDRQVPPEHRRNPLANIGEVLRDRNFCIYTVLSGMLNVGQTNFFGFLTLFLTEAVRASQPMAGFAMGLAQTASALARIGWGSVSDKAFGGRRTVLKAWICGAAAVLLVLMAWVSDWAADGGIWIALALTAGLGITIASFAPVSQAISVEAVPARLAGSAVGFNMVGVHIGGFLGPVMFGAALDAFGGDYAAGWLITAAVTALGVALLVFAFREGRRPE
ncbi:MAG: MFS transporter [Rhodospirillaceae bacterium]|jgi:MFS transporter, ACS family, hexuronate transporter|nr:MFS transporter [Rhodospirillaceae bacterium]